MLSADELIAVIEHQTIPLKQLCTLCHESPSTVLNRLRMHPEYFHCRPSKTGAPGQRGRIVSLTYRGAQAYDAQSAATGPLTLDEETAFAAQYMPLVADLKRVVRRERPHPVIGLYLLKIPALIIAGHDTRLALLKALNLQTSDMGALRARLAWLRRLDLIFAKRRRYLIRKIKRVALARI